MNFINSIIMSVFTNVFSAFIIALIGCTIFIIKNSVYINAFRRHKNPEERVLETGISKIGMIKKFGGTNFLNLLPSEKRELFVNLYKERTSTELYNNPAIRINRADDKGNLDISLVEFYDFITTNLMVFTSNSPIYSLKNMIYTVLKYYKLFDSTREVKNRIQLKIGEKPDFEKVLSVNELANIAAVNILIEDKNGEVGLVKRSNKVAVSSGHFSVSVGATPSKDDFEKDNPFLECAIRKIKTELGIEITEEALQFQTIVISKQKMQPIFLYTAKLDKAWKDYFYKMEKVEEFSKENQGFYVVPPKDIMKFVKNTIMSDESAYQLWKYFWKDSDKNKKKMPCLSFKKIESFCRMKKDKRTDSWVINL